MAAGAKLLMNFSLYKYPAYLTFVLFMASFGAGLAQSATVGEGCEDPPKGNAENIVDLINRVGLKDFQEPPVVRPVSEESRLDLVVDYAEVTVAGCRARLRSYNGAVVGPTIVASPGDTLYIRLINRLPDVPAPHPQNPPPPMHAGGFSFNITNLHTHGLHVAPEGPGPVDSVTGRRPVESDNVLLELPPGETQLYEIAIPEDHAAGTFWYHAHVHGGTAVQVGSGMAGALIIESGDARHGDLEAVPEIAAAADKVMVLQQIWVDTSGTIEKPPSTRWPTLVNGQLAPVVKMRPGEVQRWRVVHAGVNDNLVISLEDNPLVEVAADGISLGRRVDWPALPAQGKFSRDAALFLAPGYRSDVLVRVPSDAQPGDRMVLRQHELDSDTSIVAMNGAIGAAIMESSGLAADVDIEDLALGQQILVQIVVEGEPVDMALPDDVALSAVVPAELTDISQAEIDATNAIDPTANRSIELAIAQKTCDAATGACTPCVAGGPCGIGFTVNDKQFTMMNGIAPLNLRTGGEWTASEWTVKTGGFPMTHPFHIHVNPFQVQTVEPDGVARWRWKDTWATFSNAAPGTLRMRYRVFTGRFVLHCHILGHEDVGMMSVVEIVDN